MTQYLLQSKDSSRSYVLVNLFRAGGHYYFMTGDASTIRRIPDADVLSLAIDYIKELYAKNFDYIGRVYSV